jgi:hypothetical protein
MKRPRQSALVLGLLTLIFSAFLVLSYAEFQAYGVSGAAAALILMSASLRRPRSRRGRYGTVAGLAVYCAIVAVALGVFWGAVAPKILAVGGIFLAFGATVLIWSAQEAGRKKIDPRQAYFRN